jgi:hypothetical protein
VLRRSTLAVLASSLAGAVLTHWMVSSLVNDVPGQGWYHDSCTWIINAAIRKSGLNVELAASVVACLARAIAPSVAVLIFLKISGMLTASRAIAAMVLGCLFAAGAPMIDAAFLPERMGADQVIVYEIARALLGSLFLMWIIAPRQAHVAPVPATKEAKTASVRAAWAG